MVERARLENEWVSQPRGFESHPLRRTFRVHGLGAPPGIRRVWIACCRYWPGEPRTLRRDRIVGLVRALGKRVYRKVSRVRISLPPPDQLAKNYSKLTCGFRPFEIAEGLMTRGSPGLICMASGIAIGPVPG